MTSIAKDECADANRHCPFGASRNIVENFAPKRCKAERYLHFAGHSTDLILCCDVLNGDNGQRSTLWFIDDAFLYVAQSGCRVAMARNCASFSRPSERRCRASPDRKLAQPFVSISFSCRQRRDTCGPLRIFSANGGRYRYADSDVRA